MQEVALHELEIWQQHLLSEAERVMDNAYEPYSKFSVGCALMTKNERIYVGANNEIVTYDTICAERAALCTANSAGDRSIQAVAVIGRGQDFDAPLPITPCGICRQRLYEFSHIADCDFLVICSNTKKTRIWFMTISELLPFAYGPNNLHVDLSRYRS